MVPMTSPTASITIVGGGASGVLLAAHLLRKQDFAPRITLVERSGMVGQGLAYSTQRLSHRLNVSAGGMSAYADDPEHFLRWLRRHDSAAVSTTFVARSSYSAYLRTVLAEAADGAAGTLAVVTQEVTRIRETAGGVETILANSSSIASHKAILAVGHETDPPRGRGIAVRVGSDADVPLDPNARVMILGSGLSMVDAWIELAENGHKGPIIVVSRNGLLPKSHSEAAPLSIDAADVPLGTNLQYALRWLRELVAETVDHSGDWRSVIDGLRPFNQRLWQSWSLHTRKQFLRHARAWWNIHRHRIPDDLHATLVAAREAGQITLLAGEFQGVRRHDGCVEATIRRRGVAAPETLEVDRIYDCGGVSLDVRRSSNPLISDLIASGNARPDPLGIGLDVNDRCQLIDAGGNPSPHIRVIGPLTRGQFFEIEAIPDIRRQCADLANQLAS